MARVGRRQWLHTRVPAQRQQLRNVILDSMHVDDNGTPSVPHAWDLTQQFTRAIQRRHHTETRHLRTPADAPERISRQYRLLRSGPYPGGGNLRGPRIPHPLLLWYVCLLLQMETTVYVSS